MTSPPWYVFTVHAFHCNLEKVQFLVDMLFDLFVVSFSLKSFCVYNIINIKILVAVILKPFHSPTLLQPVNSFSFIFS